jgi:hypothetical protein
MYVNLSGNSPSGYNSPYAAGTSNTCNLVTGTSANGSVLTVTLSSSPAANTVLGTVQTCDQLGINNASNVNQVTWQFPSAGGTSLLNILASGDENGNGGTGSLMEWGFPAWCSIQNGPITSNGTPCPSAPY